MSKNMEEYKINMRNHLSKLSPQELTDSFNREVGCNGWVSARAIYLEELRYALQKADIDYSAVTQNSGGFSLNRKVKLENNRFVLLE
jgi:hypothetical protein